MATDLRRLKETMGERDTFKHNYYSLMAITSKAQHQTKHNSGSNHYNIEH